MPIQEDIYSYLRVVKKNLAIGNKFLSLAIGESTGSIIGESPDINEFAFFFSENEKLITTVN